MNGHFTNHSLRATAATRLFEVGIDEQLIMHRTGHSTTSGVRTYKRASENFKAITSSVLNSSKKVKQDIPLKGPGDRAPVADSDSKENKPVLNFGGATNFTVNFNFSV